jgi:hypothetical protein
VTSHHGQQSHGNGTDRPLTCDDAVRLRNRSSARDGVNPFFWRAWDHWGMASTARIRRTSATFYGADHRQVRSLAVAAYRIGDPCAIGGEPLTVAARWLDLAHDNVNGGYLGLSCRRHNRSEAATRGNRARGPLPRAQRRAIAFKAGRWR